jgi:hypothetical protein
VTTVSLIYIKNSYEYELLSLIALLQLIKQHPDYGYVPFMDAVATKICKKYAY